MDVRVTVHKGHHTVTGKVRARIQVSWLWFSDFITS